MKFLGGKFWFFHLDFSLRIPKEINHAKENEPWIWKMSGPLTPLNFNFITNESFIIINFLFRWDEIKCPPDIRKAFIFQVALSFQFTSRSILVQGWKDWEVRWKDSWFKSCCSNCPEKEKNFKDFRILLKMSFKIPDYTPVQLFSLPLFDSNLSEVSFHFICS